MYAVPPVRGIRNFLLDLRASNDAVRGLGQPRLERAIGVLYRPETERQSHCFHSRLPDRFVVILHYDTTRAVEPLEHTGLCEVPETYPTAL